MALYLGDTKLTGTGVQVDNALSSTSNNPVENKTVMDALTDVGYSEWVKPSDWVDIRSGALPNSIYLLVGHSADYSTYPQLAFTISVANSGTYDIFVDGIKKESAKASASNVTLNWQTLALTSGYDVTYPSSLKTHIVRITPTSIDNAITKFKLVAASVTNQGILWLHSTVSGLLDATNMFGGRTDYLAPVLEAVTTNQPTFLVTRMQRFAENCSAIKELPVFDFTGSTSTKSINNSFTGLTQIKKIRLKNLIDASANHGAAFQNCSELTDIITENSAVTFGPNVFDGCVKLKHLPPVMKGSNTNGTKYLVNATSLRDTFLDLSAWTDASKIGVYGSSTHFVGGIKGVIVSDLAPFGGASPQLDVSYTGLDRGALVNLFNSMPTVTGTKVCNVTGATGASDLTASDLAIATAKGWTVTR